LLCTLAYLPSLNGPLLEFDDTLLITNNPAIRAGADGLKDIWQGKTLDYFPLTNTLFWIEWHAGGSIFPQVFRVVNLLLHLTAAGLLGYLVSIWLRAPNFLVGETFLSASSVGIPTID